MHIILTHEQADFDALASLLGAYLLNETALPLLPRRLNRNVRAFITLYGMELPFVEPQDLPDEPVNFVTMVDTQSRISVKGMGPKTQLQVIDHHPLREGLPEDWIVTTEKTGATATILVEALREQNGRLDPIHSTLLLLGIYEDTGSLTYTRTTSRDLRAAAFLLEQGASLQIANDFLNHPLSQAQQELYERLRTDLEHFSIHGHTVVIACGDAREMEEELSSVAHKLRDLLDPDAFFMLVTTRGGVQLIARSTCDNIDVAAITAEFGGGGHERAAAGLIRDLDVESLCAKLVQMLPEYVYASITVSQIMSRDPQLLAPDTPVKEASQRMRRYGYEGFPVVQNGRVIGLLTRRAVDRAMAHKLNLNAASLMEAGEHTVKPDDSTEQLQHVMTETGWGQIPVVDPGKGQIIGIVTRTDLLKTLTHQPRFPGRPSLTSRLESVLPAERLALLKIIAGQAHEQRAALYIVGGFVRDLLLELPSLDFDFVVEGDAIVLAQALAQEFGGRVTSHSRFGTAKWHISDQESLSVKYGMTSHKFKLDLDCIDFVSARTEFYTHPTALPTVERGSIKLDLHRRDFTINTLALRLDGRHYGELQDYWGGFNDIRDRIVRVLHSLSFVDDPTRILRAARFEQRFKFSIESRTMDLLIEAIPLLDRLSGDRIRHELDHILVEATASQILSRLQELNLLTAIEPALVCDDWLIARLETLRTFQPEDCWNLVGYSNDHQRKRDLSYILWFIRLSSEELQRVIDRLRIPTNLVNVILSANDLWRNREALVSASSSEVVAALDAVPPLSRFGLFLASSDNKLRDVIQMYITRWQYITPMINGHDLKERGIPPGPIYRKILSSLRAAWVDGDITSKEEEIVLLEELIQDRGSE